MAAPPRVVVVGGGISGLAAAHFLLRGPADTRPDVTVVEASDRLGGKISTQAFAGRPVDTGPESLLIRAKPLRELIDDLGLLVDVVEPAVDRSYVWSRGRLCRLPAGTVAGVAAHPFALLRSGLLSPAGLGRAGADLLLARESVDHDRSVRDLVGRRFGGQVLRRLADPLLGGVFAGSVDRLSATSAVPELTAAASDGRSIWWGLRRVQASRPARPSMVTLRGGLSQLVEALSAELGESRLLVGRGASALESDPSGYRLRLTDGRVLRATAVILAVPAFAAAELLGDLSPRAVEVLSSVPYSDVATVTLAYPRSEVARVLDGTGFLVPSEEGLLVVGCTWLSAKWPHLSAGSEVLLRAMVGRHGDGRFNGLDDDALVARVHDELASILGLSEPPLRTMVQRWPRALPQYTVGHRARLALLDDELGGLPGLRLTGAAYRGGGVAGCVTQAQHTAQQVLSGLRQPQGSAV